MVICVICDHKRVPCWCWGQGYLDIKGDQEHQPLGGSVVKNLPANVGDPGLIPSLGRSHMLQNSYTHVPQLLSLCSRAGSRSY